MKRYIYSSTSVSEQEAEFLRASLQKKLEAAGLSEFVSSIDVEVLSTSYSVSVRLIRKKPLYGTVIRQSPIRPSKIDQMLDELVYKIDSYVHEGRTIKFADSYLQLWYLDNIPLGYYQGYDNSRSSRWYYLNTSASAHNTRFKNPPQSQSFFQDPSEPIVVHESRGPGLFIHATSDPEGVLMAPYLGPEVQNHDPHSYWYQSGSHRIVTEAVRAVDAQDIVLDMDALWSVSIAP